LLKERIGTLGELAEVLHLRFLEDQVRIFNYILLIDVRGLLFAKYNFESIDI